MGPFYGGTMSKYRQCELRRHGQVDVAWIPSRYADPDNYVILRGEDGWLVTQVYAEADASLVEDKIKDARTRFPSTEGR